MFTLDLISLAVLVGVGFLGAALVPVVRLLQITRSRHLRRAWLWLAIMIVGFIIGYLSLIGLLPRETNRLLVNLICAVLVMGGVFVMSVAILALRTAADVARLVHLEHEVIVDPLTGAYNRRYFAQQFDREVALAARTQTTLGLLVIDFDHFKAVNDTHGHAVGDRALAVIGAVLSNSIRKSDVLVRYGGEEFVVIAPATNSDATSLLAWKLCEKVRKTQVQCPGGIQLGITVSIGFATTRATETGEMLFSRADAAVYEAKRAGRNRVFSGDEGHAQTLDGKNVA